MQLAARVALICLLLVFPVGTWGAEAGGKQWVTVADVFDGDTFMATNGDIVRLLGIDCPERATRDKPGEPLAAEAREALKELIGDQRVWLKTDVETHDRYDRLLAQVYLGDGTWVNGELITRGLAYVYTFPPNMRWADELLQLERPARSAGRGMWSERRFRVLAAETVGSEHVGQFRVIAGVVRDLRHGGLAFGMAQLEIGVPEKYRRYFSTLPDIRQGARVLARGTLRRHRGQLRLALHSPADLEILSP